MSNVNYVIVGAEVDQAAFYLHPDGTIDSQGGDDGVPLNVEFIGKLMVELSKRGKDNVPAAELKKLANQVKHALMVRDFSVFDGSGGLTDAERKKILDATVVSIEFETRDRQPPAADKNRRILVVPSDKTLELQDKRLRNEDAERGFSPPLSYELDHSLMLASMRNEILQMIRSFVPPNGETLSQSMREALEKHMKQQIRDRSSFKAADGTRARDVKNAIMKSPLRAFHRSVGIYATNMCR